MINLRYLFVGLLLAGVSSCGIFEDDVPPPPPPEPPFYRIYNLTGSSLPTELPHQVNMLFQVVDQNYKGVPGLSETDLYRILEDGDPLSSEAKPKIDSFGSIPFNIKTVVLLDVSSSVEGMVGQIKSAAIELVNNKTPEQQIAIYTFDSKPKLIQDFSKNKNLLTSAIQSISETNLVSSTNIYGSLIEAASKFEDQYTIGLIEQGSIILFTDGKETTGSSTFQQAQWALGDKQVFVLGLKSSDLDEDNLQSLASDGKIVYANNISEVKTKFLEIQSDIVKLSKSVYWLYFQSPRRGGNYFSLNLSFKENRNTGVDASASGQYSSSGFTD